MRSVPQPLVDDTRVASSTNAHAPSSSPGPGKAKLVVVAIDAIAGAIGLWVALLLGAAFGDIGGSRFATHAAAAALALPLWLLCFAQQGLYQQRRIATAADEVRRLLRALVGGAVVLGLISFAGALALSRAWVVLAVGTTGAIVLVERGAARIIFRTLRVRGRLRRRVVVLGANEEAEDFALMLAADPSLGYDVVGLVDSTGPITSEVLLERVAAARATGVVIPPSSVSPSALNGLARDLLDEGIHVELPSPLRDVAPRRLTVRTLGRYPVTYLEPVRHSGWRAGAKRCFDVVVAMSALVLLMPLLWVAAAAIRLDSPGPVFFRQRRIGRDGRPFEILKLRTMVVDAEAALGALRSDNEVDGPLFKMSSDPRVTRVGRILRKFSLDEIPQFFNVLRNEMSVVGPRPALAREMAEWTPEVLARLRVKPGITGAWQVNGRSRCSFDDYVRLDLYYVDNWSLLTDLLITLRTVPAVLTCRGAS